jgi:hypothetical protein
MIASESPIPVEDERSSQASEQAPAQWHLDAVEKVPVSRRHWWRDHDYDSPYADTYVTCAKCRLTVELQDFEVERVACPESTDDFLRWIDERVELRKQKEAVVSPEHRHIYVVASRPLHKRGTSVDACVREVRRTVETRLEGRFLET